MFIKLTIFVYFRARGICICLLSAFENNTEIATTHRRLRASRIILRLAKTHVDA